MVLHGDFRLSDLEPVDAVRDACLVRHTFGIGAYVGFANAFWKRSFDEGGREPLGPGDSVHFRRDEPDCAHRRSTPGIRL